MVLFLLKIAALFTGGILSVFLVLPLVSTLASVLRRYPPAPPAAAKTDFGCIITAYKNIDIARQLVHSLLKQEYPHFHVYLVADACQEFTLEEHSQLTIIRPENALGSKVKSLLAGMNAFIRPHDALIVFDPDNLAHPDCLSELNDWFCAGYKAVQGQRVAKNLDTRYACMDALGEYYYNYSVREVPFRLGSSSTISGSAMAVETGVFRKYLQHLQAGGIDRVIVAEDKILQIFLVDEGYTRAYAPNAFVFDEKVSSGGAVSRQRTRWLNAWFSHTGHGLNTLLKGIAAGSFNRFYFGLLNISPPMFMLVAASVFTGFAALFVAPLVSGVLVIGTACFALNFFLCLKLNHTPKPVLEAFFSLPLFVLNQITALLQIKKSDKDFMATTHTRFLGIDEVMQQTTHRNDRNKKKA